MRSYRTEIDQSAALDRAKERCRTSAEYNQLVAAAYAELDPDFRRAPSEEEAARNALPEPDWDRTPAIAAPGPAPKDNSLLPFSIGLLLLLASLLVGGFGLLTGHGGYVERTTFGWVVFWIGVALLVVSKLRSDRFKRAEQQHKQLQRAHRGQLQQQLQHRDEARRRFEDLQVRLERGLDQLARRSLEQPVEQLPRSARWDALRPRLHQQLTDALVGWEPEDPNSVLLQDVVDAKGLLPSIVVLPELVAVVEPLNPDRLLRNDDQMVETDGLRIADFTDVGAIYADDDDSDSRVYRAMKFVQAQFADPRRHAWCADAVNGGYGVDAGDSEHLLTDQHDVAEFLRRFPEKVRTPVKVVRVVPRGALGDADAATPKDAAVITTPDRLVEVLSWMAAQTGARPIDPRLVEHLLFSAAASADFDRRWEQHRGAEKTRIARSEAYQRQAKMFSNLQWNEDWARQNDEMEHWNKLYRLLRNPGFSDAQLDQLSCDLTDERATYTQIGSSSYGRMPWQRN